jgi:hypothetical protein
MAPGPRYRYTLQRESSYRQIYQKPRGDFPAGFSFALMRSTRPASVLQHAGPTSPNLLNSCPFRNPD